MLSSNPYLTDFLRANENGVVCSGKPLSATVLTGRWC